MSESATFQQTAAEVTKLPPPNKAAIENLFKRACHTINSQSPVDMSDPSQVSRVLGELFANMHEEETRWLTELSAAKGWVCDLPEKLGSGTYSWTAVNATTSRVQVSGNAKWTTPTAVEFNEVDRSELDKLMLRFIQEGSLVEMPASGAGASDGAGGAAATSRITLMRDSKEQMRVFHVKGTPQATKNLVALLDLAQRVNQRTRNPEATAAGLIAM